MSNEMIDILIKIAEEVKSRREKEKNFDRFITGKGREEPLDELIKQYEKLKNEITVH